MAMTMNFVPTELMEMVFTEPGTGKFVGSIEFLDDLNISNGSTEKELRSGVGNAVIYSTSSEFTSDVSGTCIMSRDLFSILTSTEQEIGLKKMMDSQVITASGTTVLLPQTPSAGGKLFVFPLDQHGRRENALKLGTPATNAADYSITNKNITVHSSLSGNKFKVVYEYDLSVVEFGKEAKDSKIYEVNALCKAVDLSSKEQKIGMFKIPSFKPSTTFEIGTSNGEFVKAQISGKALLDVSSKKSWMFYMEE